MIIRKYIANSINEGLAMVKKELGINAVIVSQRKIRKSGLEGFFRPKIVEITAAVENSRIDNREESINNMKKLMEEKRKNTASFKENEVEKLKEDILEIKKVLGRKVLEKEEETNIVDKILEEYDIAMDFREDIKRKISGYETLKEAKYNIMELINDEIDISTDDLTGNVVFVGPTGVGKTTTIAKIAGILALKEKKKVGLITIDTYRIGAVEQLKTYAEIMNLKFEVVFTLNDMEKAIQNLKDCDVVLIDSTGRSSKNLMQIRELNSFIDKIKVKSVNLVISSTTKNKDLKEILEGYRILNYRNLIITKLDETTSYGVIYNIQKYGKKPIRYLTIGQNVPDDIIDGNKEKLRKIIFKEEEIC